MRGQTTGKGVNMTPPKDLYSEGIFFLRGEEILKSSMLINGKINFF